MRRKKESRRTSGNLDIVAGVVTCGNDTERMR